jgi:steroid 5-alpha reductase family enzyme
MNFLSLWLAAGLIVLVLMTLLWLYSLKIKNSSIVDIFWGTGFVITYWAALIIGSIEITTRILLLGAIVTLWGLRLSFHIFSRNHGQPEDFRYAAWREEAGSSWWWRSFFKVFLLQGVILLIVAAPLIAVLVADPASTSCSCEYAGLGLWLAGFMLEAGGDAQLARFRKDPNNQGKLLTTGFWSITRHPNYFGDAAQWWGFWLFAFSAGAWWTVFSPLLMTYLLMKVSGVAMLERTLKAKPGYEDYMARTSAFFPWFPKK